MAVDHDSGGVIGISPVLVLLRSASDTIQIKVATSNEQKTEASRLTGVFSSWKGDPSYRYMSYSVDSQSRIRLCYLTGISIQSFRRD